MSIDGRVLARARERKRDLRADHEKDLTMLRHEIYRRLPRVREIDGKLRALMPEVIAIALKKGLNPEQELKRVMNESLGLQEERERLMRGVGLDPACLDAHYICEDCRDSGFRGAEICHCLMELYREEARRELSVLLKLGDETFENFNLGYYPLTPEKSGIVPREHMAKVLETARGYAEHFEVLPLNFLFQGGPGLGKTYLSACIARVVSESGHSVVYDTVVAMMNAFEIVQFSRNSERATEAESDVRRYLECDLLILDDLGTETSSSFTNSALYTLLNTRLANKRRTIISTNLDDKELKRRYSQQILSRLQGEYTVLRFFGRDIRRLTRDA